MKFKFISLACLFSFVSYAAHADCTAVITPAGPTTFCSGDSVVLNAPAGSGLSYEWKRGSTVVGTGSSFTAKDAGDYTVAVDDGSCKQTSPVVSVTVKNLPGATLSPTGPLVLCPGQSKEIFVLLGLSLPGAPLNSYLWKNGNVTVRPASNDNRLTVSASGTYTVLVTSPETGCSRLSEPYLVTVNPLPTAVITPSWSTEICDGGSVELDAGSVAGYDYQWKRNGAAAGVQPAITATEAGDYKVIVTDEAGCKDSSAVTTVNVHPKPDIAITQSDTAVCAGELVLLNTATTDTNLAYAWHDAAGAITGAEDTAYETGATGEYYVIVSRKDVYECADTSVQVQVTVNDLPEPEINHEPGRVWTNGGFDSYQWYQDDVLIPGAEDSAYATDDPGVYQVMVTDGNGCSNFSDTLRVMPEEEEDDHSRIADQTQWNNVTMYPNPAHDMLYIQAGAPVVVDIIDMDGRLVMQQQGGEGISLGGLQTGVYFIRIMNEQRALLKYDRFVKQ